jgi:hypothetical protein
VRTLSWQDLAKYFIHGIVFSLLFVILGIAWAFIWVLLIGFGSFIGLIIGIVLLLLIVGFLNAALGAFLWNIDAGGKGWSGMFFHGLVLFVILLIVDLAASYLPNEVFPGMATVAITLIIRTLLYGIVGKTVCTWLGRTVE